MERFDCLDGTPWRVYYDRSVFPPGTDSFLLSAFPALRPNTRVCDLGCGTGLLGLLLLRREPCLSVTGMEISPRALELAGRAAAENGLAGRMTFLQGDLRRPEELPGCGSFDLAVCNPPYFSVGAGAPADGKARQVARSEAGCTVEEVCRCAARLLRWDGRFCLVYRPERLCDALLALRESGLEPKRLRMVQNTASAAPSLVLIEGRRGGRPGLRAEPPLLLQNTDGTPSAELNAAYGRSAPGALDS